MSYQSQNDLLLNKLLNYYKINDNLEKMINIINGSSRISLRIVDWFTTNFSKKFYTIIPIIQSNYNIPNCDDHNKRFKVYINYKLNLKAYSKKRFDPFCRWERINIPFNDKYIQTTIGQLNFFKWALENKVIEYIEENYEEIEKDMNSRNTSSKNKENLTNKTRKKREELSISATKSIKKEDIQITINFD